MPVAIRINGVGTEWHSLDLDAVARSKCDVAVLPRATSAHLVREVREAIGKPLLAMIETAAGVLAAAEIAREVGGADRRDQRSLGRPAPAARRDARADFSGAADDRPCRAGGRHCRRSTACSTSSSDPDGFVAEAAEGRRLGFDGKSLIHPDQIEPCNRAFGPSEEEIERARRLVDAFSGGAERFEDQMIERMHVEAARRVLERAARS